MSTLLRAPEALVLMYHRVVDARDPFWLQVRPDDFVGHLDVLQRTCDVVPLEEIRGPGTGRRRVAITFDDGYVDNLAVAAPLLAARGCPATVFVVSDLLDGTNAFWWDRLEHLVLDGSERIVEIPLPTGGVRVDLRADPPRQRALQALGRLLRPLAVADRETALDAVAAQVGRPNGACSCHAHLDRDGIVELAAVEGISIGAHTRTHACLAGLDLAAQIAEIGGSRRALEAVLGQTVRTFAYPYGSHDSWDHDSVRAAAASGVRLAVTTIPGDVTATTPRLRTPRMAVRRWSPEEFEASLELWFRGGRTV